MAKRKEALRPADVEPGRAPSGILSGALLDEDRQPALSEPRAKSKGGVEGFELAVPMT
ncbi:MAG: hypothetical protein ACRD35_08635 [Candidatus Acidiferrales bacterium]